MRRGQAVRAVMGTVIYGPVWYIDFFFLLFYRPPSAFSGSASEFCYAGLIGVFFYILFFPR
jgi:hypothetical protein